MPSKISNKVLDSKTTRGGLFFCFFHSIFALWTQKNFWSRFWIFLTSGQIFLAVCLFPAKIWGRQKNFGRKIVIFGKNDQILTKKMFFPECFFFHPMRSN